MRRTVLLVVFCMMMGFLLPSHALAEDAAAFYKGNTITVLIPTSQPGGGFDLATRAIVPYFEKYTGSKVLIEMGRPILTENKLYRSKPDGLTVELIGHGGKQITAQLFKMDGVKYDWTKFVHLARLPYSSTLFFVNKNEKWNSIEALRKYEFRLGTSTAFYGPLIAEAMGFEKMKVIPGMSGGGRAMAIRKNEIHASVGGTAQVAANPDVLLPILATSPDANYPNVPPVTKVALKGKEKWAKLCATWDELMYHGWTTPGVPKDRVAFLEKALEKVYHDPAFRADMKKLKYDLSDHFVGSKELGEIAKRISDLSTDEIEEMRHVIREKYMTKR